MIEVKTSSEIEADEFYNERWVRVSDVIDFIKRQNEKGNLYGGSFSPALCLSDLKKELMK